MSRHTDSNDAPDDEATDSTSGRLSDVSRRDVLKAAGASALTAGFASNLIGSAAAVGIPTPALHRDGNLLKDPSGNEVILRGVNIADPARLARSWRSKDSMGVFEKATNTDESNDGGWHSHIIRVPTQPQDISSANNGLTMAHQDDWGPLLPGQIDETDMEAYFSTYVDPIVDAAEENGTYIMIDYHRHFPIFHQPQHEDDLGDFQCGNETFPNDIGFCGERGVLWNSEEQASQLDGYAEEYAAELHQELQMYWNFVAPRYSDRSHVIYDVYNEPTGPYAGDWGTPTSLPHSGNAEGGQDVDVVAQESKQYWDMWVDRAQPWIDTVREHADNLLTIGSPRWSQYTYWAPENEFQGDDICYTGHVYTHESMRPLSTYYGSPAEEVPVFFSEFGWAEGGGSDNFDFLAGTADEYASEFETFLDEYPVHPICWNFDHTWEPAFFQSDSSQDGSWEIWNYQDRPGQWWQEYLEAHADEDLPQDGGGNTDTPTDTPTTPTDTPTDTPTETDSSSGNPYATLSPSTTSASVGERVTFQVQDQTGSRGWITGLDWTFGDGTSATGWWNAHRYDSAGSYTVTLTTTVNTGETSTDEVAIDVS